MTLVWAIVKLINGCVLALLVVQSIIYLAQLYVAFLELRQHRRRASRSDPWWMLTSGVALPISILVPAHNEEETIVENVRSMLALHYPDFEVIVINDGSQDRTLEVLIKALELHKIDRVWHSEVPHQQIRGLYGSPRHPRLLVVDKVNGGKSDALNAGINLSRFPIFCAVDADSLLDHDSLLQVMRPFIEEPEEMVAVGAHLHRERLHSESRAGGGRGAARAAAAAAPEHRIHPRLPYRAPGVEPLGRDAHHLRCVRFVPAQRRRAGRRLQPRHRGRRHGNRGEAAPAFP